jgi:DUF4097 and DUF4098 domain-containing protein YvlB
MWTYLLAAAVALAQTDQTVTVQKGTRLEVSNFAGEVIVRTWDRDAVRVEAEHSDRETVDIRPGDQRLIIRGRSRTGAARSLDYTLTVPKWMSISVTGTYTDVTMEGVGGDVNVETTRGDIAVGGGNGFVTLKSVQGNVSLKGAKGRIDVANVNEGIQLADISGDVTAGTTNGDILLERIDSPNVDVYTVNGNITYDGPIADKGAYRITTHNGAIRLALAEKVNATLTVRTYNGEFRSSFPVRLDDQNTRRRFTLTFGSGSARVEVESFNGPIQLRRPGEPVPQSRRERSRGR